MYGSGLSIMLAASIWGVDGYVRQNVALPQTFVLAIEMIIAGLLILGWVFVARRHEVKRIKNLTAFIGTVLLGGFAGSWFFAESLKATDSLGFVFVLIGLQPVFTIISSAIFLGEKPRPTFYIFALTTVCASILLSIGDTGWNLNNSSMMAYIYALLTAMCWGVSTTFHKTVAENNSISFTMGLRFVLIGIVAFGLSYFTNSLVGIDTDILSNQSLLLSIAFLVFISDILAGYIYLYGLKSVPATLATIFELTFPLTGFVLDYFMHDMIPSPMKIVAAFTVLASIIILPHCHFIDEKTPEKTLIPAEA